MYLPKEQVVQTLARMAESFTASRIVIEVIAEKYTRGFRKKMVEKKMRKGAGSTAGDFYQFGIRSPKEPEAYHPAIKLNRVWSYYEDPDIQPGFLKIFKHIKSIAQTQYTVVLDIT